VAGGNQPIAVCVMLKATKCKLDLSYRVLTG